MLVISFAGIMIVNEFGIISYDSVEIVKQVISIPFSTKSFDVVENTITPNAYYPVLVRTGGNIYSECIFLSYLSKVLHISKANVSVAMSAGSSIPKSLVEGESLEIAAWQGVLDG